MFPGLFVSFEGIDGCGKTTQLALLAERLRGANRDVVETAEPGGTATGRAIRSLLLDPGHQALNSRAELLLYFASRAQNVAEVILPALDRRAIVLCDRFTDSTLAYQGAGRGMDPRSIRELHRIACGPLMPHLTLLLDIDLDLSLRRARRRNEHLQSSETRMDDENREFFERVREQYRALATSEPERIRVIDARASEEAVSDRIWEQVRQYV